MHKLLAVLAFFFCATLFASNDLILEIKIKGNKNIENELIRTAITFDVGQEVNADNISKSIKNLYQLGVFSNISIDQETLPQGVSITINVEEYPILEKVKYAGNRKVDDSKLDEIVTLHKGGYLSPFQKAETTEKIQKEYEDKGYSSATISYEEKSLPSNHVEVVIKIDEGGKVKIRKINIYGNTEVATKKILGKMKTKTASLFRSGKFEEKQYQEDLKLIVDYYNQLGYIDARIKSAEVKNIDDKSLEIDIHLYEGQQFLFGKVTVSGNERFTENAIMEKFTFRQGDIFNMEEFDKQLTAVSSLYYEEGYIYSSFDHEIQKNGKNVDIFLTIVENTRAKIRKINIIGNRKTKEKIIRRQLDIAPGDYFRQSALIQSQRSIYNLGFFEPDIALDYEPINNNGDLDLTIKVNDKMSGSANGGVGYNSQDHFVGQFSVSHDNLFGNAWSTALKWEFGGTMQNIELSFTDPYFLDTNILVGGSFYHTTKEWDDSNYEIETNGGGVKCGYPLPFLNFSRFVAGYSLYAKKYMIMDDDDYASSNLVELDSLGWQYTSAFSLTLSRDSRDNVFFPSSGSQIMFYTEIAGGPFGGNFDYYKQIAQINWYTKLFWKVISRNKWRFGYVASYGKSENVPPDERFYLGGTGVDGIRGYPDRSIGPSESEGGLREAIFSSEIAWPFASDQITGILFFDAGNSFNDFESFNFWEFKKGAGTGIRIQSPLGLIGFDYAYSFENRKWEPHFQFGTTF